MDTTTYTDLNEYINYVATNSDFINTVRRASVTLSDRSSISDETIRDTTIYESFPRIVLRLATVKDKNNNPIFKGIGYGVDYEEQLFEIYRVITKEPFSSGLIRVASSFTAATLIRSLPLNSDMKFLDSSKFIEEQAINDLDMIMGILREDPQIVNSLIKESTTKSFSLFFSQEVDYSSIPPYVFDQVKEDIALLEGVRLHQTIRVPPNHFSYIHLYISNGTEIFEVELPIRDGADISEVVNDIANNINKFIAKFNLIASVTINPISKETIQYTKNELYKNSLDNAHKQIMAYIYPNIHRIDISSKASVANFSRELISISSITKDRSGNIIGGVLGLVHGTINNYKNLTSKGPHSLLISLDNKGYVKEEEKEIQNIDTFYFRLASNYLVSNEGVISIKISNLPNSSYPTEWNVNIPQGISSHQIVELIHDSFYKKRSNTQVTTSISNINTLQIIPFVLCPKEIRIVVHILNIPEGLEIATGDISKVVTLYANLSRSVSVKSQLDYVNYARLTDNSSNKSGSISAVSPPKHSELYNKMTMRLNKLNKESYKKC